MLPADVDAATEMVLGHGWGVRRDWLAFAASSRHCQPVVAEADGAIVATGVGTANGPVGWLGTVFVAPELRGHGLGRAVTQAVLDRLDAAGCRTILLVATTEGRRLYERMGFEVQTRYRIMEAAGLPEAAAPAADGPAVRSFEAGDLAAMVTIDREATGEDRRHALERLAGPETAWVVMRREGDVTGFLARPPWGGGATVARTPDDALAIIEVRRRRAGPAGLVRVGVLDENADGIARLVDSGFTQSWTAPRMVRGEPMTWHPERIWGQFNHAMG